MRNHNNMPFKMILENEVFNVSFEMRERVEE